MDCSRYRTWFPTGPISRSRRPGMSCIFRLRRVPMSQAPAAFDPEQLSRFTKGSWVPNSTLRAQTIDKPWFDPFSRWVSASVEDHGSPVVTATPKRPAADAGTVQERLGRRRRNRLPVREAVVLARSLRMSRKDLGSISSCDCCFRFTTHTGRRLKQQSFESEIWNAANGNSKSVMIGANFVTT